MLLLALLACDPAPPAGGWTAERALAGAMAAADRDGDGVLSEADYVASALSAPPFARIDGDGDGVISAAEFEHLTLQQDPLGFDGNPGHSTWSFTGDQGPAAPDPYDERVLRDLFVSLREAIAVRDPSAALPGEAEITAAANTRSLDSEQSRALMGALSRAARAAGAPLPARLEVSQ